ncbi:MAG: hypothetical protein JNK02_09115 [Planctomycetes bacterium]|nr:hypothetical protein [Planctomycetota bacterium]
MRSIAALLLVASAPCVLADTSVAQTVHFHEDFESGFSRWTMSGIWQPQSASGPCTAAAVPFPSGTNCVWFGSPASCNFQILDVWPFFHLRCNEALSLPETDGVLELRFRSFSGGEDDGIWDTRKPQISVDGGGSWTSLATVFSSDRWLHERFDISRFAGQTILLRFEFWIGDDAWNNFLGWLIDDIQIVEHAGPAVEQCAGDGTWYACPCGNNGGPGRGCASSFNPAGARITASGTASLANDTLLFAMDGMSAAAATIVQGATFNHAYWEGGTFGGDGRVCVGTPYVRIRTLPAPGGAASYPAPREVPISVRGGVTLPYTTRTYAVRYRNAASFCTGYVFNATNTLQLTWRP